MGLKKRYKEHFYEELLSFIEHNAKMIFKLTSQENTRNRVHSTESGVRSHRTLGNRRQETGDSL